MAVEDTILALQPGAERMVHRATPESSAIERIGYNFLTRELFILFRKNGKYPEYVYGGVPPDLATSFLLARSKGKFFHARIDNNRNFTVGAPLGSFRLGSLGRRITSIPRNVARDVGRSILPQRR
jgi:hypothetical protein